MQEYVQFSVYGIREPGEEIKVELVKLITKKLDQTTLDILNQSLARNPKSKLTPQDVEVRHFGLLCCQLRIKDIIEHLMVLNAKIVNSFMLLIILTKKLRIQCLIWSLTRLCL